MVWSVGFEPTKTASYTLRPVPILSYGLSGSSANSLTTTYLLYTLKYLQSKIIFLNRLDEKFHRNSI